MDLNRFAREFYSLDVTTTPATTPTDWSASFDAGKTWTPAIDVDGHSAWLVAGRLADPTGAVATLRSGINPLVRLISNPEIVVRDAPPITVT